MKESAFRPDCRKSFCAPGVELAQKELPKSTATVLSLSKSAALGLKKGTVLWYAQQIYRQHGVASLKELLRKHGHAIPPPLTKEVRRRLLAGESIAQIDAETGAGKMLIYNQRQALRKAGYSFTDGRRHNGGRRNLCKSREYLDDRDAKTVHSP